jgi:hypothetical protein
MKKQKAGDGEGDEGGDGDKVGQERLGNRKACTLVTVACAVRTSIPEVASLQRDQQAWRVCPSAPENPSSPAFFPSMLFFRLAFIDLSFEHTTCHSK